jgi:hypothetical protein
MSKMKTKAIQSNSHVIFKCPRSGIDKRGMILSIENEIANVCYYDGKYSSQVKVKLDLIRHDTEDADIRIPIQK